MTNFKTVVRRFASLALALMLVATMAIGVSAKSFSDVGVNDYAEQIDILSDIGIIVGTSETEFSPNAGVTREQMALLLFRTMLGRSNAGAVNTTGFIDLYDTTYSGAISWANAAGIIIGQTATTFGPTGGITLQDAMTMIVRALGQSNAAMDRGYPWTYIDTAVKLGLDDGLSAISYTKSLTRAETAVLIYNALTAEYLIPRTGTTVISTTVIENVFGYDIEDCLVVATNNYTIENYPNVIKNGYITVQKIVGVGSMTISFEQLGLEGTPENWLGKTVKLIFKTDAKTNLVSVLGASYTGAAKNLSTVEIAADGIIIDGVKYEAVAAKSGTLATNKNELYVYIYDNDGSLAKLNNNAEVAAALKFFNIELIKDKSGADTADRAIIKPWTFGQLTVTGGLINIAGNLTEAQLTGGFINTVNAETGDYVFYYFNTQNKSLEIAEVLTAAQSAVVTRLTAATATIGAVEYKLTYAPVNSLTIGQNASVIAKNGYILAVIGTPVVTTKSKYLIATSAVTPVYINGFVKYAFSANINGVSQNIVTAQAAVIIDGVYRYTVDAGGVYTLYAANNALFTQNGDIASIYNNLNAMTISMASAPCYTVGNVKFVTDSDTVIIVKNNGVYSVKTGAYTGDITINAGASVTAVFNNNVGDVETLAYLFITDGSLARTDIAQTNVKILTANGAEYINNTVYYVYTALNISNGQISAYKSIYSNLIIGSIYATDVTGNVLDIAANPLTSGIINGYTASTVTIDGTNYRLTANTSVIKVNADNTATALTLAAVYTAAAPVTFYAVNGDMILIIA
ncbi:MAG: S-layer homology domain-containing protein [Eubacteriales bacterium]